MTYVLSKNCKLLIYALWGAVFVENLDGGQFILFYDRVDRLSQTRPIPRSPDGDKKKLLFHKAAFMLDKQNWTIMLKNGLVLGGLHIKHYMGHEVAVTTTKHFTNRP